MYLYIYIQITKDIHQINHRFLLQVIFEAQDLESTAESDPEPAPDNNDVDVARNRTETDDNNSIFVTEDTQFIEEVDDGGGNANMQLLQIRLPNTNELAWVNIVASGE